MADTTYYGPAVVTQSDDVRTQFIVRVYQHLAVAVGAFIAFEVILFRLGLAERLYERRARRGALDLDVPEVKARVAPDGRPVGLERRERLLAHRVVEEFMLLANTLVGEEAERRGGPFLLLPLRRWPCR